VAAPGENVYSIAPGNDYATKSGSSFSAALVSGEAALLYSKAVDINNDGQINDEVFNSIVSASDNIQVSDGPARRINVYDAAFNTTLLSETLGGN
jgi:subtilisin family serine protease